MGVGFAFMWSSAFTSAKIALLYAPPLSLLTVRFLLSGVIALVVARFLAQPWPRQLVHWRRIVILGVCQNSLYLGLFFVAMTTVPAGLAAIIASAMPLLVAAAGALFLQQRLASVALVGLVLGFGGVVLIVQDRLGGDLDGLGLALCLVGVSALATATLIVRHAELGSGLWMVVGLQMLSGSLTLLPFALWLEWGAPVTLTTPLVLAFLYTTFVPGLAATLVWFALIRRIGAAEASAYHFLNPAFGVAVAWLLLHEPLGPFDMAGVAVVAVGILLVQRGPRASG
ncbi:MAG: DMT family transporter [Geminicoccaceae bacterium]|nr:MAG: DMT family transporter [Geminicoccaceae bacterium]